MGDGVENDDTGRRERSSTEADGQRTAAVRTGDRSATEAEDASAESTEVVEPLTLEDPTDGTAADTGEPARPTGGQPTESTGQSDRSDRRPKPDLELVEPVELDDPDDGLATTPSESGPTPPVPDATAPPGPPGAEIDAERVLAAFVDALRDDGLESQVADVRRELLVDRNQDVDERLKRLETAIGNQDVDERLKRLETAVGDQDVDARLQRLEKAVKQLADHVTATEEQPTNPNTDSATIQELRDGLDDVRSQLETIAALELERASSIEALEKRVEALCRWQETVSAVAGGPNED